MKPLKKLLNRLIDWAYSRFYTLEPDIEFMTDEAWNEKVAGWREDMELDSDVEIVFEPIESWAEQLGSNNCTFHFNKEFDNEIDEAMYEKQFYTLH